MNTINKQQVLALVLLMGTGMIQLNAQSPKKFRVNLGMDVGYIILPGLNKDVYPPDDNNSFFTAINLTGERLIGSQSAVFSGVSGRFSLLKLDAMPDADNRILPAPDSVKYGMIRQNAIEVPLGYRFYFKGAEAGRFIQAEVDLGYAFRNHYEARINRQEYRTSLANVSSFTYAAGIGYGVRIKQKVSSMLLVKINYRFNPYFTQKEATSLNPLNLSVGYLF